MKLPSKLAAGSAVAALVFGLASPALATNLKTKHGNETVGCNVAWDASAVMNTQLTNKTEGYSGLMVDRNGDPVNGFTNGGYIKSVWPTNEEDEPHYTKGDPGLLEVTHFYNGGSEDNKGLVAVKGTQPNWRTVVATDYAIKNAKVTLHAPADMKVEAWSYLPSDRLNGDTPFDVNGYLHKWGKPYDSYTYPSTAEKVASDDGNGNVTLDLGDLNAKDGRVLQLTGQMIPGERMDQNYVASATLTGEYDPEAGIKDCPTPAPTDTSDPTPSESGEPTPSESGNPTPSESGEPTPSQSGNPTPSESGTATPSASGSATATPLESTTSAPAPGSDAPSDDAPQPGDNGDGGDNGGDGDNGGNLPRTGSDAVAPLLAAGGALLLVGAGVLLVARRRRS
ncbi:LPXTG cell wall anchor domain-containing protein [Brevibacterium sp. BRM-1]|uniref:LPXTG cell wall anchor domain-containing protein n=1 Tax=Brevibacterium sp. BRM-1 TaxID=2999062 RepID=UPI00227F3BB6|nr:LPXTG cell wall anchor domain-containing protein [Brevibacterium sp. BRM-1]WAL40130.1 LPXTG cell wall anchor domain-containing protein [Brevibacterium sp. BRM-1]